MEPKDWITQKIEGMIKPWMVDSIMSNMEAMVGKVSSQTAGIQDSLSQTPSEFEGGVMWRTALEIGNVLAPVAAIIFAAALCLEILALAEQRNNFHTPADVQWSFMKLALKIIGVAVVLENYEYLTEGIFQLGAYVIAKLSGGGEAGFASASLEAMRETLDSKSIGYLLPMMFTSFLGQAGIHIISVIVWLAVMGRMFKICLYCSMGAVPWATLANSSTSDIGKNFIKNLFALSFQGFMMFAIVIMYEALVQNITVSSDPSEAAFTLIKYSVVFAFALFSCANVAKSIFNAH